MYPIGTNLVFYTQYSYLPPCPPPQEHGLHMAALSNEMCILQHKVASLEGTVSSLQRKAASQEKKITFLEDRVSEAASLESTIASLESTVASLQRKVLSQEKKITSLEDPVSKAVPLESTDSSLERTVASLERKAALQGKKITFLQDYASDLTLSFEAYKRLRNRFISTFKRDKLGKETWEDHKMIEEGNRCAHGGDVVADAKLYKGTLRRGDECDFELLYGLPPSVVANLSKSSLPLIATSN